MSSPSPTFSRILSRFDLIAIYVSLIFWPYGAAQMVGKGWDGIPMYILAVITFLIPASFIVYELGTLFPEQGWIYVWIKNTFNKAHWFVVGWLSWLPIIFLMPLVTTAIVKHIEFLFWLSLSGNILLIAQGVIILLMAWLGMCNLKLWKKVINFLFIASILTALIAITIWILYGTNVNPFTPSQLIPNFSLNGAIYSAAILWLLWVEDPFNMTWEVKDVKKAAKTMLTWGNVILAIWYLIGMIGILLLVSAGSVDPIIWLSAAVWSVSPLLWKFIATCVILGVLGQWITYFTAYSRLLFVFGEEKIFWKWITKQLPNEVPINSMILQTVLAIIITIIFSVRDIQIVFNLYLASLIVIRIFSLYYMYLAVPLARKKHKALYVARKNDIWLMPWWNIGMRLTVSIAIIFNTVAIYYVFLSPRINGISTFHWRLWIWIISVIVLLSGFVMYWLSKGKTK